MIYDVPVINNYKFEKADSTSFSIKGHEMVTSQRLLGLQFDHEMWSGVTHALAESVGQEMNALGDDMAYDWFEEDDDDVDEREWLAHNLRVSERRMLPGSRGGSSILWIYMWLSVEGFMNFAHHHYPKRRKGSRRYEVLSKELETAVADRSVDRVERLLLQIRDVTQHSRLGTYQKVLGNLSGMWYHMCSVYFAQTMNKQIERSRRRRHQVDIGSIQAGSASLHSAQMFFQEKNGEIVEDFLGGAMEFNQQLATCFPLSYEEMHEWFQRGFNGYGGTYGMVGVNDQLDLMPDIAYGQVLRTKMVSALERGSDADVSQILGMAEDVISMSRSAVPNFRSYCASTLSVLAVLYSPSNANFLAEIERVPVLKLRLVDNLHGLKGMINDPLDSFPSVSLHSDLK